MRIYIRTITCKTITLEVEPLCTIQEVKELILEKEGIPIEVQRLFWAGKPLEDETKTLADWNIHNESTIHIIMRAKE